MPALQFSPALLHWDRVIGAYQTLVNVNCIELPGHFIAARKIDIERRHFQLRQARDNKDTNYKTKYTHHTIAVLRTGTYVHNNIYRNHKLANSFVYTRYIVLHRIYHV